MSSSAYLLCLCTLTCVSLRLDVCHFLLTDLEATRRSLESCGSRGFRPTDDVQELKSLQEEKPSRSPLGNIMDTWFADTASLLGGRSDTGRGPASQPSSQVGSFRGFPEHNGKTQRRPLDSSNDTTDYHIQSNGEDDIAGVHAVMLSTGDYPTIDEVPNGGQLCKQGVGASDLLMAVDSRTVKALSLKVVKAMIEGLAGSVVHLLLQRPTGEKYEVRVVRTNTLAEDIQLATYGELQQLLESPLGTDFYHMVQSGYEPQHAVKAAHDSVCSKINDLKQKALGDDSAAWLAKSQLQLHEVRGQRDDFAQKLEENFREGEKIIKDLRDTLSALDVKAARLKAELDDVRQKETSAMTLGLRPLEAPPADPAGRKEMEEILQKEIADVLQVHPDRVEIIGLQKGSLRADLNLLSDPTRQGPTPKQLTDNLLMQKNDPMSAMQRASILKDVETIEIKDPHEWITRLRATVDILQQEKGRLAQDLAAAHKDLETVAQHKDQRFSKTLQQLQDRERELERLSREVGSQAEARKVQLETVNVSRNMEETRLRGLVAQLSHELEHEHAQNHDMQRELQHCQAELQQASSELRRLELEVDRGRNRETQIQADIVLLNQKHQQVLTATEKALGDANSTMHVQKQELAEMDRVQKRGLSAEDALRTQTSAMEQMKIQMKAQMELNRTQADNEQLALANQYSAERKEFEKHLDSAEGTVRSLRGDLEQRMRAQAELVKKLDTQFGLNGTLGTQLNSAENQARKLRNELDVVSTSNQVMQKERERDQAQISSLTTDARQLRVEENAWKRIEKARLLGQLDSVNKDNDSMRSQIEQLEHKLNGVCLYMHIYVYTIFLYARIYIYMCIYIYVHIYIYICININMYTLTHMYIYIYVHTYMCVKI